MSVWTFDIDHLGRPQTMNKERNAHHHASAAIRKSWREAGLMGCRIAKVPKGLTRIGFIFQPIYDKGPLPDPGALAPTTKGIIDGCVDHGVVPDDSGAYVAYVCELAPIKDPKAKPGVRVIITDQENQ